MQWCPTTLGTRSLFGSPYFMGQTVHLYAMEITIISVESLNTVYYKNPFPLIIAHIATISECMITVSVQYLSIDRVYTCGSPG